jgi:threonine aldolase
MQPIDLRSDTVTRPTAGMREAMARAEVGDDVLGDDPTVRRLEERVAEILGKEAALFFPSGTMANQACLRLLTRPGDVVLGGRACHVLRYESGAAAALSGLQIQTLGSDGLFEAGDVAAALPAADVHRAPATVVAVENTHNHGGGRIFPLEAIKGIAEAARARGLALHLDGARLWNAVVASGVSPATWAGPFDSVSVCLSKGLGAPLGSLVGLSAARLGELRRIRKMLGGGMRQVGIVAAAGLHALDHHVERLAEDHANARRLAAGLEALGLDVERTPDTNIVMFESREALRLQHACHERGVWMIPFSDTRIRAVTHLDVSASQIDSALERIGAACQQIA